MVKSPNPGRLAFKILNWFCPEELRESIEGDLIERFEADYVKHGRRLARFFLLINVLFFFRWEIISRNQMKMINFNTGLLMSHIKIALRNYKRHFSYTLINLLGLAVGVAVCLVIYSYTRHELSYDSFYSDVDHMYRINQTNIWSPEGGMMSSTTPPLAKQLKENLVEVTDVTRINTPGTFEVRHQNKNGDQIVYRESNVLAADSNFFDFFNIPVLEGDPDKMLEGVNRMVVTENTARRYFGTKSPLGEVLLVGDDLTPVIVSGVVSDLPSNMHFKFDILLSMGTNPAIKSFDWSWIWTQVVTYVKTQGDVDVPSLSNKITDILIPQVRSTFDRLGMDFTDFMKDKGDWKFELQPVRDIHLYSADIGNRLGPVGDIKIVRILQIMAGLILLIAVINFVNLSTARSNLRSREIGVKKTMGATMPELARQFQMESVLMTFMASLIAIPIALGLALLIFRQTGIQIFFDWIWQPYSFSMLLLILFIIGFVSGIYPSIYLTGLKPVMAMDQHSVKRDGNFGIRNFLVTVQFTISLALLSGGLLVTQQLQYLSEKDLGFDRENILVVRNAEILGDQIYTFRNQVANDAKIVDASVSMSVPGEMAFEDLFQREGSSTKLAISQVKVDPFFSGTMNLKMVAGRFFLQNNEGDKNHAVINETTARLFGWTAQDALGEKIVYPSDGMENPEIIGVVSDFHFQSLYESIKPLLLLHIESPMWGDQKMLVVKYQQTGAEEAIASVRNTWDQFANKSPFSYTILDEDLDQMYTRENQLSTLVNLLCLLSIFTAILGLIGLVSFTVEQRRKEIGVRKVLGASSSGIFLLINRQYLNLFLIGLFLSVPLTWWMLSIWLQDFAYHIQISWYIFVMAGVILLALCLFSVGMMVIKAARTSPVEAIRNN